MKPDAAAREAVRKTVAEHPEKIAAWLRNEPGSWGFLAGQAVVACRQLLGRSLTEAERRVVWERMWRALLAARAAGPSSAASGDKPAQGAPNGP